MAAKQLRERVTEGVAWSMAEKIGSMLLTVAVRLVILRLLSPDILGCIAIPAAVVAVAMVIADSGFSQNLIRRDNPSPADYKSVFLFNMAVSTGLYVLLTAAAPAVARYYAIPEIAEVAPVFFLLLPVSSLCSVQNAIFTRQFRFALLSKVTFLSSLAAMAVRAVLLWRLSDWRPRGRGSVASLRDMAPFSVSLMLTDLISTFYMKLPQFFLGKLYPTATLGAFDQAVKLKDMPVTAATQSVQSVTFPALSEVRGDAPKFAESYRQVVLITAYVMFPAMLGLSAVAHDLFALLLSEKWMPTVPYFEVVCLAGLFYPVGMICYNVLKVMSRGPLIVRLEVVKKLLMTVVFAVTIPHSVMAVVWGLVVIAFGEMAVNFLATRRFTRFTTRRFLRTLLPVALVSGTMYLLVRLTACAVPGHLLLRLAAQLLVGAAAYVGLSVLFRLEAFGLLCDLMKKQAAR